MISEAVDQSHTGEPWGRRLWLTLAAAVLGGGLPRVLRHQQVARWQTTKCHRSSKWECAGQSAGVFCPRWSAQHLPKALPVWYAVQRRAMALFPHNELGFRIPSLIFGILTAAVVFLLAARWRGLWFGLALAIVLLGSQPFIYLSQVNRFYSMPLLLLIAGPCRDLPAAWWHRDDPGDWPLTALAVLSHNMTVGGLRAGVPRRLPRLLAWSRSAARCVAQRRGRLDQHAAATFSTCGRWSTDGPARATPLRCWCPSPPTPAFRRWPSRCSDAGSRSCAATGRHRCSGGRCCSPAASVSFSDHACPGTRATFCSSCRPVGAGCSCASSSSRAGWVIGPSVRPGMVAWSCCCCRVCSATTATDRATTIAGRRSSAHERSVGSAYPQRRRGDDLVLPAGESAPGPARPHQSERASPDRSSFSSPLERLDRFARRFLTGRWICSPRSTGGATISSRISCASTACASATALTSKRGQNSPGKKTFCLHSRYSIHKQLTVIDL